MAYLLDTHALIWFMENDPQLPQITRNLIETTSTIFISIVSLWEIAIKANIGKLTLAQPSGCRVDRDDLCKLGWGGRGGCRLVAPASGLATLRLVKSQRSG